ncbi:hypothetical protein GCM10007923_24980 [Shinella yambaruensis]|uniref:Uncharacterized protein n=1 Tax=Shinella yambaruensis TaxID=415996 RepID=A0ABQ5ZI74_9HYPH|nr:hypothetical protein GCM10007923_24980 [Shinella yambaruensis]
MSEKSLTYGERLADEFDIYVYCYRCDKNVKIDPTNIEESARPLGLRFVCVGCDGRGQCTCIPKWRPSLVPGERIPYGSSPFRGPK